MDITLTMRQPKRIEIIERALRNDLTVVEAAMVFGVSERQCYRVKARVRDQGVKGVLHGNRGRPEAQAVWENYLPKFNRTFSKTAGRLSPPGERSTLTSSNSLCVLSTNARWPMITPSTSKGRCFRFQRILRRALTPVNGLTSMSC